MRVLAKTVLCESSNQRDAVMRGKGKVSANVLEAMQRQLVVQKDELDRGATCEQRS